MDDGNFDSELFKEPEGYCPPPPEPKFYTYESKFKKLRLRVVGSHSLWGHYLWNASIIMADYIEQHSDLVAHKNVLELGAGAGLPSIVSALNNAHRVVMTDYPDANLVENLTFNVHENHIDRVDPLGYLWGSDVSALLKCLNDPKRGKFDTILLSDLLFNHSQHHAMLKTCDAALADNGQILVTYSSHRPWLEEKDRAFFSLAETEYHFKVKHVNDVRVSPMFDEDPGDVNIRSTVHMYILEKK